MPFDGRVKDYETKADVFSLEGLIAWLETQNPETEYDYTDISDCLLTRWMRASGQRDFGFSGSPDHTANRFTVAAGNFPHTYGAALRRARKLVGTR